MMKSRGMGCVKYAAGGKVAAAPKKGKGFPPKPAPAMNPGQKAMPFKKGGKVKGMC